MVGDALAKFGVDMKQISVGGDYAGAEGQVQSFTPKQRAAFSAAIDRVYDGFIQRVATGRNLSPDRVREIARGRVWTGADAKERGLVDELGGFWVAVDDVKKLAGIDPGTRVRFKSYPSPQGFFDRVSRGLDTSSASVRALQGLNTIFGSELVRSLISAVHSVPNGRIEFTATGLPQH